MIPLMFHDCVQTLTLFFSGRIIEAESLVLQKSIEKYAQNLMSIQQPTITLTDAKDNGRKNAKIQENNQQKSDRLICTNTESYETERRRLVDCTLCDLVTCLHHGLSLAFQ